MQLFRVLPILSLLFGARASSLDSRRPDAHPLDARDVSDVCATLDPGTDDDSLLYDVILMSGYYGQFNFQHYQPISSVLV